MELEQMKGALATKVKDRLAVLDEERTRLSAFLELCSPNGHGKATKAKARKRGRAKPYPTKRMDWNAVLAKLPQKFAAADVTAIAKKNGLGDGSGHVTIGSWVRRKLVKRYLPGKYEKVARGKPMKAKGKK